MNKLLILDNYDSFTYNLYQLVRENGKYDIEVRRNDRISLNEIEQFDKIILSPGPGIPEEAGLLLPIIKQYASIKPILGVCLGHQAIAESFGARLSNLKQVHHGIQTPVRIDNTEVIFQKLPKEILVGRYHSWIVDRSTLPECIKVTASSAENEIMALRHSEYKVYGIQFHPESVLTPDGKIIIDNFLNM